MKFELDIRTVARRGLFFDWVETLYAVGTYDEAYEAGRRIQWRKLSSAPSIGPPGGNHETARRCTDFCSVPANNPYDSGGFRVFSLGDIRKITEPVFIIYEID